MDAGTFNYGDILIIIGILPIGFAIWLYFQNKKSKQFPHIFFLVSL
jgi:hypothetical protein